MLLEFGLIKEIQQIRPFINFIMGLFIFPGLIMSVFSFIEIKKKGLKGKALAIISIVISSIEVVFVLFMIPILILINPGKYA